MVLALPKIETSNNIYLKPCTVISLYLGDSCFNQREARLGMQNEKKSLTDIFI